MLEKYYIIPNKLLYNVLVLLGYEPLAFYYENNLTSYDYMHIEDGRICVCSRKYFKLKSKKCIGGQRV